MRKSIWTVLLLVVSSGGALQGADIPISPNATYLRTNADTALSAQPISLSDLGIRPGSEIVLTPLGDFNFGTIDTDLSSAMVGVFTSSSQLLSDSERFRLVGAIDAGEDFRTAETLNGQLPTDIAEDFLVGTSLTITVPEGAGFLFVSPVDSRFADNRDLNGDFGIRVTSTQSVTPEPAGWSLLASALIGLGCLRRKQR